VIDEPLPKTGRAFDPRGAIHTPLYSHSTFAFPNTQSVLDVVEGRATGTLYTRYGRRMRGGGGMLSFVLAGDAKTAAAFVDRLKLFSIAPRLGGVESLVTQPVTTTHHGLTPEERSRRGISGGRMRVSVGLEDTRGPLGRSGPGAREIGASSRASGATAVDAAISR